MKIVHVITGLRKAAGTSVFCGEICNQLVALGHDVTITCNDPDGVGNYPVDDRIKRTHLTSLLADPAVFTANGLPDLVHVHALWSPQLHGIAVLARRVDIPVVWSPHGMLTPWALKNKWWKKIPGLVAYQWRDLHSTALLHATAESEVADIRRIGLRNKVVVAPLGVNLPTGVKVNRQGDDSRRKTLLFVSRVQRKKGLPNLIRAWAKLKMDGEVRAELEQWTVRIVGPDEDGHVAELKTLCDSLNLRWNDAGDRSSALTPNCDFTFVGPKFGKDLAAEYENADLFVLPTHSENFGSVVIEALAHSVPVICTKGAPWQELEKYCCGWWVDIGVEPLVTVLRNIMCRLIADSNVEFLRSLGYRGRELVASKYTWPVVAKTMIDSYESIV